ncbi:hypothetical protein ACO1O0_006322 [Amphichorda felina]
MATRTQQHHPHYGPSAAAPSEPFTPAMRDRQARGKDPYSHSRAGHDDVMQAHLGVGQGLPSETFEEREKKEFAMAVLDNPDMLLMHAQARGDSVAGQRLRFLRMMCPVEHEKSEAGNKMAGVATGTQRSSRGGY